MVFFFHYLSWHYGKALGKIIKNWLLFVVFLYHYFSIGILMRSLFAPWHRQALTIPNIFPLGAFIEAVTFNLVSSVIGALIRAITIVVGMITMLVAFTTGLLITIIWSIIPVITVPLYLRSSRPSEVEKLKQKSHTMKEAFLFLFSTKQGDFIIKRLHLPRTQLISQVQHAYDAALPAQFSKITFMHQAFTLLANYWAPFNKFLDLHQLNPEDVKKTAIWYERIKMLTDLAHKIFDPDTLMRIPGIGHTWVYGYTQNLDRYTYPISAKDNPLGVIYGYKNEIHEMEAVLSKLVQNSILVVGEPGSGRHALVEKFADLISKGYTIPSLRHKRIMGLSLNQLIRDAGNQKDVDTYVLNVLHEAQAAGNIILIINQLDHFVGPESQSHLADVLSQILDSGRLQIIGITTPTGYYHSIKYNERLIKDFTIINIEQPTQEQMITVLENVILGFESKYNIFFTYQALKEIIVASTRLFPTTPFPEKAIDALNTIVTHIKARKKTSLVLPEDVDAILSKASHIPYGKIKKREKQKLLNLENLLHQRIINQEEAITVISSSLRRSRLMLGQKKKPIGSFLFLGPTGVGKTETAKALAAIYFEDEKRMLRLDMSQYKTTQAINRLIGSPDGQPGELAKLLSEQPFSVLLLDEFEKATTTIHNLFLTIFDEGYITDTSGKKIIFHNTIIIATSNAGAEFIREQIDQGQETKVMKHKLIEKILTKEIFTPELVNRFDQVVVFKPLTPKELKDIARLQLEILNNKLQKKHEVNIDITEELIETIAILGYKPEFGARPMKRVIAEKIENVIAQKLLRNELKRGQTIKLTIN